MNATQEPLEDLVKTQLRSCRDEFNRALEICDKAESLMLKLPVSAIAGCAIVCGALIIYEQDREGALSIIRALGGYWQKNINATDSTRIDYSQVIDGLSVQIWGAQPPTSCRIIEEEIEVPAHKATKRTLVCH